MPGRGKLILIVVDGLTPAMLERAFDHPRTPAFRLLGERGAYGRATSMFPSLTPVCLSSIATGAYPDVHEIPHLVWYHRGERRVVEYGSSWAAVRRAGAFRSIHDTIFGMNQRHLGVRAATIFETLEDAGLTTAAVNITCYRGRTRHLPTVPGLAPPAYGPKHFFYYSLFESDRTGAPVGVMTRSAGGLDAYAAAVGRWLVTRDAFDLLVFYLPDYDFASHLHGPDAAEEALVRADAAIAALVAAAGGEDAFFDRYGVVLCSDHGQSRVDRAARLQDAFSSDGGVVVCASNRAGQIYRVADSAPDAASLARRLDADDAVEVALFLEHGVAVARRDGEELRFAPDGDGWRTSGDSSILGHPDALLRSWAALGNPNAGDVLVSAAPGVEFLDLAGRSHLGGGSHGSLAEADSVVPVVTVGVGGETQTIADVARLALSHFGVQPPAYARAA